MKVEVEVKVRVNVKVHVNVTYLRGYDSIDEFMCGSLLRWTLIGFDENPVE